jgi:hypothetical protein
MRKTRYLLLALAIAFFPATLIPTKAWPLDLGLTPSHVYSLWINIDKAVLTYVEQTVKNETLIDEIRAMEVKEFSGKTPGNVLFLGLDVEGLWDALRISSGFPPTRQIAVFGEATTPSDVYIASSRILGAAVEWIIGNTPPGHLVSEHFIRRAFRDKTPSDVYGLVDLAHRRMHAVSGGADTSLRGAKASAK